MKMPPQDATLVFTLTATVLLTAACGGLGPSPDGRGRDSLDEFSDRLLTTVTLVRPLYFRTSGDASTLLPADEYAIESAGSRQLKLTAQTHGAVEIEAIAQPHEHELDAPLALAVSDEHSPDLTHVALFLPNGTGLGATGSASGVFPRQIPVHVFAAFAKMLATGSPMPEALTLEADTNRPGHDFRTFALPYGACQFICQRDQRCQAFTWQKDPAKVVKGSCRLKDAVPPATSDTCCSSGVKPAALLKK
ncbi:MAG: PAN domain-containing protein [Nitrospirae bacterium]|nr:PAN domain-containing protein [Nitrospirota bacterium]